MLNVVIADDSLIIRKMLNNILGEIGCKVVAEAKNGKEAVTFFDQYVPDLITMDIEMPVMNGIEATKEIRKNYPDANIVMITSHGQEDMVKSAIKNGAKGYILKSLIKDKLSDIISKFFPLSKSNDLNSNDTYYEILEDGE